jgi:hypothetical protein
VNDGFRPTGKKKTPETTGEKHNLTYRYLQYLKVVKPRIDHWIWMAKDILKNAEFS